MGPVFFVGVPDTVFMVKHFRRYLLRLGTPTKKTGPINGPALLIPFGIALRL